MRPTTPEAAHNKWDTPTTGGEVVWSKRGGADRAPREGHVLAGLHPLDITSEQQRAAVIQDITATYGRIDVLIHAAGVLGTTPDILDRTTEEFESIMRINASATFSIVRETAKSMLATGTAGAIVILSSVAAKEARLNYLSYNASKPAVLHIIWPFAELPGPNGISVKAIAVFGGTAPLIAAAFVGAGQPMFVAYYMIAIVALSLIVYFTLPETGQQGAACHRRTGRPRGVGG